MILPFPRQQPFNTLSKLPADPKQDLRPNLYLAALHRGEIAFDRPHRCQRGVTLVCTIVS
jgi:hypothetical protein